MDLGVHGGRDEKLADVGRALLAFPEQETESSVDRSCLRRMRRTRPQRKRELLRVESVQL